MKPPKLFYTTYFTTLSLPCLFQHIPIKGLKYSELPKNSLYIIKEEGISMWVTIGIIIFSLFLLVLILALIKLSINITFHHSKEQSIVHIQVLIYKWKIYKKELKLDQYQSEQINYLNFREEILRFIRSIPIFYRNVTHLLSLIELTRFEWKTKGGTGDAVTTGISTGAVWAIKGIIIGFLREHMKKVDDLIIDVTPYYQKSFIQTDIRCMISIRLGKAIYGILQLSKLTDKQKEVTNHG